MAHGGHVFTTFLHYPPLIWYILPLLSQLSSFFLHFFNILLIFQLVFFKKIYTCVIIIYMILFFSKKYVKTLTILLFTFLFACSYNENSTLNRNPKKVGVSKDYGNETKDIVIFSTNDTYSAYDDYLGYAGIKHYIDHFDRNGNYITLVDTGNFTIGSEAAYISKGKSSIEIMKAVGYDLIVPGSFDFDYGIDTFLENMNEFKDKVVCCNLINLKTKTLVFNPYVIYKYGNEKVAFVGVTSPEALYLQEDDNMFYDENGEQIYYFCEDDTGIALYNQVQKYVNEAKKNGATKVILLAHLGISGTINKWTSTEVIGNTKDIDGVIDGHSMEVLENGLMVNNHGAFVPLVQAGSQLKYLGAMNITNEGYSFPAVISDRSIKNKDENILKLINELKEKYKS